ncbi:hypothetical protein [Kribbella sp.]|uniref:hypothetical protein n=1 Tax=Kribbella sp. TaxID=1871183 RepID=UPI002D57A735|nr:hypothetical protein [Kribbella sp.]HZX09099.1 hypothetical protein [Kribbella sp.]
MLRGVPGARPLGPDAGGQWVRRWRSVGWEREVDAWVGRRLAEGGRRVVGEAVTYRARFWSVVRCYPTGEGLVWFKENNPGHRFEAGLVAAMAEVAPEYVAVPIAVDRERGWLLTDDQGTTLTHEDVADQATRRTVVRALARLQCALLGRLHAHPGVVELAPTTAGDRVRAVAREWAALPAAHPLRIERDLFERVEDAADALDRSTASISDLVPMDVELNDVYPANIFADRSTGVLRPRFFDFGNTLWAHPFVTLHGFLDSVTEWTRAPLSPEHHTELVTTYLTIWRNHLAADPAVLRQDLKATKPLLNPHRLISWLRLIPHADPTELQTRSKIPLSYLTAIAEISDPHRGRRTTR